MINQDNITVGQRLAAPTPKFFKVAGSILGGLVTAATVIVAAPVALPAIVTTVAGYVLAGSALAGAVGLGTLPVDFNALAKQKAK